MPSARHHISAPGRGLSRVLLLSNQPPSRCSACRFVREWCVCSLAPKLNLSTRVVVVMHSSEWLKASNTGHFVQLALNQAAVRLHGLPHIPVDLADVDATAKSTLVLFPGHGAKPLTPDLIASLPRPATLLVPDGNWNQAKAMMRRIPALRAATPVELPGPVLGDRLRPRRNILPDRMSSFEAIAQTLGLLEGEQVQDVLLDFFCTVVDRMMVLRGKSKKSDLTLGQPSKL